MADEITVVSLLRKLSGDYKHITWKMGCAFNDGQQECIYEIYLYYQLYDIRIKRVIAFYMDSGRIIPQVSRGIPQNSPEDVIDMLLDLINLERVTYSSA